MLEVIQSYISMNDFLMLGIKTQKIEWIRYAIDKGADIKYNDNYSLKKVCLYGHIAIVKYLVDQGSDIFSRVVEKGGGIKLFAIPDPIVCASEIGQIDIVRYLVEQAFIRHYSTRHDSSRSEHGLNMIKYLKDNGIITTQDVISINVAGRYGHLEVIKYLIEQGSDIHREISYVVYGAAENGYLNIVKYLIEQNCRITPWYSHPMIGASEKGHLNIVEFLMENSFGIKDEILTGDEVIDYDYIGSHKYIFKTESRNNVINRSFITACKNNHLNIVKYLLKKEADIHIDNNRALRTACKNDHSEVIKYLLKKGADIHTKNNYPLRMASRNANLRMVRYLELLMEAEKCPSKTPSSITLMEFFNGIWMKIFIHGTTTTL